MGIAAAVLLVLVAGWYVRALTGDARFAQLTDFENLERTGRPNDFLVAPPGVTGVSPDMEAPVFAADPKQAAAAFEEFVVAQPRTRILAKSDDGLRFEAVQRSFLMRYPDYISIAVLDAVDSGSTVAVYSRSIYGHSDLGVNHERVESWLDALAEKLGSAGSTSAAP